MQYRIVVPDQAKSGQTIKVHCPDGSETYIQVPKGVKPGDSHVFDATKDRKRKPKAHEESTLHEAVAVSVDAKPQGFLNREIGTFHDFVLACCVGMIIGMGIVMGFFLGVLYATKDIPHISPTSQPQTPPGMSQPRRPTYSKRINGEQVKVEQIRQEDGKFKTTVNINVNNQ